ncbi:MAG: CocE/NonD family hydrolase [FCB group bacterium]|jgi:predicted acyl esterase|nr:CocE/NonD family hydrolase [FCB group bacterium]
MSIRMRGAYLGLLLGILCASVSWAQSLSTVMVPMRDGVRLASDCYLPAGPGPFPVVLIRTIYGKGGSAGDANAYLSLGYAVVVQDTRGRFESEGVNNGFESDGWGPLQDGIDTLAWIRAQPECNGRIATAGGSALGITQVLNAAAGGEITCQIIRVAPSQFHSGVSYMGGVFVKNLVEDWTTATGIAHTIPIYKAHPTNDDYWSYYDAEARVEHVTAPALHMGGWFDIFQQGTIDNFVSRQHNGGPGAKGNQKLIIGPWTHGLSNAGGELSYPTTGAPNSTSYQVRFLDCWLNGTDNGIMSEPAVNYYVVGAVGEAGAPGNVWRTAEDWPPFPTVERELCAAADGALTMGAAGAGDDALTFTYNPANPCPTVGGQNLMMAAGVMDQRPVSGRPDVLRFATPPLTRPMEIAGRVRARLYVSSDAPDTDFTAKLVDIYPNGREMLMLDSIQRVKFRNSDVTADPLVPGQVGVLDVDMWSISLIVNTGHRIGLQISSSNYPRFEINPNTGDDFPGANPPRVAHNTLHTGAQYPSALILPLRDSDNDALPDYDEAGIGTDPNDPDTDGDWFTDKEEVDGDSDPTAPTSIPWPVGDVNHSHKVDAADVQAVINGVLGRPTAFRTDIDLSGESDARDVQLVINAVLHPPAP